MQGGGQQMDWYTSTGGQYSSFSNTNGAYNYAPPSYNAYSTNFEDEPPLLEELGIDVGGIVKKSRAILLYRMSSKVIYDLDMGGALLYVFLLGGLHLLMGKLHFGVILGWSVVQSIVLYFVVNQLAGADSIEKNALDLYSCCCLVGYCMAPICLISAVGLMVPRGLPSAALAILAAVWSSLVASRILVTKSPGLEEQRSILAYPCLLIYGSFALLTAY